MATARRLPVQKPSAAASPRASASISAIVPLMVGFSFPLVGTLLAIVGQGHPLSLGSALTVHLDHPLLWLLDLVPVMIFLLFHEKNRTTGVTPSSGAPQQGLRGASTSSVVEGAAPPQKAITTVQAELSAVKTQLEQARTSEASLLTLIENAGDAIITLSEAGTITFVNRGAENMCGWTRQEMVGQPFSKFLALTSLPQMEAHLTQSLTDPASPALIETEFVRSDGHGLQAEGRMSAIPEASGKATSVVVIYRALSHRQQAVGDPSAPPLSADSLELRPAVAPEAIAVAPLALHVTPSGALKVTDLLGDGTSTAPAFGAQDTLSSFTTSLEKESDSPVDTPPSAPIPFTFVDQQDTDTHSPASPDTPLALVDTKREEHLRTVPVPFDFSQALSNIGGDKELLAELAGIFLEEYGEVIGNIRTAVANNDSEALLYHAHALKGSVGNFVAREVEKPLRLLEQLARDENLEDASTVLEELETALSRLTPALRDLAA